MLGCFPRVEWHGERLVDLPLGSQNRGCHTNELPERACSQIGVLLLDKDETWLFVLLFLRTDGEDEFGCSECNAEF